MRGIPVPMPLDSRHQRDVPGREPGARSPTKEEESLTLKKRRAPRRAARRRARARRGRLRRRTTAAARRRRCRRRRARRSSTRATGDPDYMIASDLPLQGVVAHADRADRRRRSATSSSSRTGRPATTTSASSRATTRPRRPASGTRASARQNANAYAANDERDRRHRHVQLGLRRDRHPGAEPGAGRRHRDDLAGEHVRRA